MACFTAPLPTNANPQYTYNILRRRCQPRPNIIPGMYIWREADGRWITTGVTSAATGTRTVVRTTAAVAVAGMSTGPAVKASAPGGTEVVRARRHKRDAIGPWNRSSCLSRRHASPVAMDHACTTALRLLHLHAAGLHTVSCGTLAHLVCCCCAVPVWVLVLLIAARYHPR